MNVRKMSSCNIQNTGNSPKAIMLCERSGGGVGEEYNHDSFHEYVAD